MTRLALLLAVVGVAAATVLLARTGFAAVLSAFAAAGLGVLWASLVHAVPMALNARAWQVLVGRGRGRSLALFGWLVWIREGVNGLLPVARVGGEVATARLLIRAGVPGPQAVASLVVDLTIGIATQLLFTLAGVTVLAADTAGGPLVRASLVALAVTAPVLVVLAVAQRGGSFERVARAARSFVGRPLSGLVASGRRLDRATRAIHRSPLRLARCAAWQLAGWGAGAAELLVLLAFLGHPIAPLDALAVEAIVQAASSAAFLVPGALGVQEGGFAAAGAAVGLPPEISLALALGRRARDLVLFLPALVAWQWTEARSLLRVERSRERRPVGGARLRP